jgi:hypothetical protein
MNKDEARRALDAAIESEGERSIQLLDRNHEWNADVVAATNAAIDAFAAACEEEARAGIAAWIAAAPARMDAQAAAGAQPLHYMHTIGQLAAVASLAEAIKNKVDLNEGKGAT